MTMKYIALASTTEFPFSVNDPATGGSADADAAPPFDVRLQGAAAGAAPVFSGTATLLSHGDYPAGQYAAIIPATEGNGFAADSVYSVYVSAAVTTTTGALIGEFTTSALLDIAAILAGFGLTSGSLDTQLGDIPNNAEFSARTLAAAGYATAVQATAIALQLTNFQDGSATMKTIGDVVDLLNRGIIYGTAETGTLSRTKCTSDLSGYGESTLLGRAIIFTSGVSIGQGSIISGYASAGGLLTFDEIAIAPADTNTFKVV